MSTEQTYEELEQRVKEIDKKTHERKEAEEALQEIEENYRSLFENLRDAVYITTLEGKIIEVNQSFLDLFGITREEIKDLNVRQLYINPEERSSFQKKIEEDASVKKFPVRLFKIDGTQIDCLLTSTVWRANDGNVNKRRKRILKQNCFQGYP